MYVKGYGEVVQKEPAYCPVHDSYAPCMFCLLPDVYELVRISSANDFYFTQSDESVN